MLALALVAGACGDDEEDDVAQVAPAATEAPADEAMAEEPEEE